MLAIDSSNAHISLVSARTTVMLVIADVPIISPQTSSFIMNVLSNLFSLRPPLCVYDSTYDSKSQGQSDDNAAFRAFIDAKYLVEGLPSC